MTAKILEQKIALFGKGETRLPYPHLIWEQRHGQDFILLAYQVRLWARKIFKAYQVRVWVWV